jgi:hypothetical protein
MIDDEHELRRKTGFYNFPLLFASKLTNDRKRGSVSMRLLRTSVVVALVFVFLLAAACWNDRQPESLTGGDQTEIAADQERPSPDRTSEGYQTDTAADGQSSSKTETAADGRSSSDSVPVSFRQSLKQLDFGQSSDTLGYVFFTLPAKEWGQQPFTIARHLDKEFSIGMELDAAPEQVSRLLSQIRVEGAANYTFTGMDKTPNRPVLRLTGMEPEIKVTLGDLPPITIVKRDPLGVALEYEDPQSRSPGLFVQPSEQEGAKAVAIVPNPHPDLVLRFNEEMDTSQNDQLPDGEWIDAYRYRLHLPKEPMHSERVSNGGTLAGFRSLSGNYAGARSIDYSVIQVKPSDWLDLETELRVGWSPNDPLYETILSSPDGQSYVGTAVVGWPEGDGTGNFYKIVLERKGKPAVTIEPYFYTNVLHQGAPVQWAGSDRVAYADRHSVFLYSLNDGARTTLFSTAGTSRYIHYAAYDPYAKQWNVLTSTFDIETASGYGPFPVDLLLLDDSGNVIAHRSEWSLSPLAKYRLMENPVIPAKNGVYRTFYRDGKAFTKFESRDGSETELPGVIQYADEQLAILLENVQGGEGEQILYLWRPGWKRPITASKAPGTVMIAGSQPVADSEGDYYKYDAKSDKWVLWESSSTISLSRQTFSGMYKKMKSVAAP